MSTKAADNADTRARDILGKDFISPKEIATARDLTYSPEHLAEFGRTLPDEKTLKWCAQKGFMLMAGPPSPMSFLDVFGLKPDDFYTKDPKEQAQHGYISTTREKVASGWLVLRKDPLPGSVGLAGYDQFQLLPKFERMAYAVEVIWGLTTYKAVRDIRLLSTFSVRTGSVKDKVDSRVFHFCIGHFDERGIRVRAMVDREESPDLGMTSVRKI